MAKARIGISLVAGCLLSWAGSRAEAAPSVAQMLNFKPKQEGIVFSTPASTDFNNCKVELIAGTRPGSNGWMLRDPSGKPLRRYFDSNGDKKVDVWSYYLDGAEVYREIDSNYNERVDQYRWLNAGGMKWGVDANEDGKIDGWKFISAEEVSQEVLQAVVTRDFARVQALFVADGEVKALELPAAEAARIRQLQASAPARFQATVAKLTGVSEKTKWVRYDAGLAQCVPADQAGTKGDLIKHGRGTILYETAGKHDFLAIGELLLAGNAWRLLEVPGDDSQQDASPKLKAKLEELRKLDGGQSAAATPAEIIRYNLSRADLILAIVAEDRADQRENWLRQLVECYSAAAQSTAEGDKGAYEKLLKLAQQLAKEQPGTPLASFAGYREMQAWNAAELARIKEPTSYPKVQQQWLDRLTQFVQAYPHTDETPEALMQLGMVSEFVSKEVEAKNWYGKLAKEFPGHPQAAKANGGAVARLEIEGKPFVLTAREKNGTFDVSRLRGKVVVVYYWASWTQQCVGDFAQLKVMLSKYGAKGLELVCVNLDNNAADAASMTPPGGVVLAEPGGLDSPLAVQYGILSLPTMFLVGADGKTISGKVQVGTLDDEIKKVMK